MSHLTGKAHTYALFAIVVFAVAFGSLTQTAMNAMLGGIGADFGVDAGTGQWVTTIYMLVMGITVPVVTYLSQKMCVRDLILLSLAFFLAGSAIDFVAPTFAFLLVGRVLQAVAAGICLPIIQSIAMTRFPAGQNASAMGVAGIAMGFAPNIGPIIGGAFVDSLGWRSFFVLLIVASAILVLLSLLLIEREAVPARDASLDVASLLLSTLGFGGLLLAFSNAANFALASPLVWVPALVGAVCLVAFVQRQRRVKHPLISMRIFASARYRASFVAQNLLFASFMGITLVVPMLVQGPMGGTAVEAGLVFAPATLIAIVANPLGGILADKMGTRPVAIAASVLLCIGAVSMVFVDETTPLWLLAAMQAVRGFGIGALIGPFCSWGMTELPFEVMMDGSAFFATVRQACASMGTAVMVLIIVVFAGQAAGGAVPMALGYQLAFGISALLSLGVLVVSVWKVR